MMDYAFDTNTISQICRFYYKTDSQAFGRDSMTSFSRDALVQSVKSKQN